MCENAVFPLDHFERYNNSFIVFRFLWLWETDAGVKSERM